MVCSYFSFFRQNIFPLSLFTYTKEGICQLLIPTHNESKNNIMLLVLSATLFVPLIIPTTFCLNKFYSQDITEC